MIKINYIALYRWREGNEFTIYILSKLFWIKIWYLTNEREIYVSQQAHCNQPNHFNLCIYRTKMSLKITSELKSSVKTYLLYNIIGGPRVMFPKVLIWGPPPHDGSKYYWTRTFFGQIEVQVTLQKGMLEWNSNAISIRSLRSRFQFLYVPTQKYIKSKTLNVVWESGCG